MFTTYYSPLIHKVTNLFKNTDLNIAFRRGNTMYNQLYDRISLSKINSSGIRKLQCKTCNRSYLGYTGRSIEIRNRAHTSKQITLYRHMHYTFSTTDMNMEIRNKTMQLLKTCNKSKKMNFWESFYTQVQQ